MKRRPDGKTLRKLIETPREVSFWGCKYTITPRFVTKKFGDGKKLLAVQPLNTRPNYYVIRIDSRWYREKRDSTIIDHTDDIVEAIIDEYSEIEREREYLTEDLEEQGIEPDGDNTDLAGNEDRLGWPVWSGDSGHAWFEVDWPEAESRRDNR